MQRTYKYRVYPTDNQAVKLHNMLGLCRRLYNAALNQRIWAHQRGLKVGYVQQANELPTLKVEMPEYGTIYSHVLQATLRRLDTAYANFFRRCKEGGAPGFPRFKSRSRFRSLTYPDSNNGSYSIQNSTHLKVSKIGVVRFFQHRPIPKAGVIKTMTLKVDTVGDWWVTFSVEFPDPEPIHSTDPAKVVGVDVGLKSLAVVSSGEVFEPLRALAKGQEKIKILQKRLARAKKGSNNREKIRVRLAKAHRKVERQRDDYLHKISRKLVVNNNVIVFENLKITNMVRNHSLARAIYDAAWGKLRQLTTYKAESAGKLVLAGNPNGTTCTCHWCGARKRISLADRVFVCSNCGQSTDRDRNAALNIRDWSVGPDWTELLNDARRGGTSMPIICWMNGVSPASEAGSPAL